jgi:PTH1 family peptidyl-tRNA hydrolase
MMIRGHNGLKSIS